MARASQVANPKRPRILSFHGWAQDTYADRKVAVLGVKALNDGAEKHVRTMTVEEVERFAKPNSEITVEETIILKEALDSIEYLQSQSLLTDSLSNDFREAVRDAGSHEGIFKEKRYTTEQTQFLRDAAELAALNYDVERMMEGRPDNVPETLKHWVEVAVANTVFRYPDVGGDEDVFNSVAIAELNEIVDETMGRLHRRSFGLDAP